MPESEDAPEEVPASDDAPESDRVLSRRRAIGSSDGRRGDGRRGGRRGGGADADEFGRMFDGPMFAEPSAALREALMVVGEPGGMLDANDPLDVGPVRLITEPELSPDNPDNPDHTAGITFVGQFLDHDITAPGELSDFGAVHSSLATSTPLWLYVLRVAEVASEGRHPGPVGGRSVSRPVARGPGLVREPGRMGADASHRISRRWVRDGRSADPRGGRPCESWAMSCQVAESRSRQFRSRVFSTLPVAFRGNGSVDVSI
jgi:hypothetical protein